MTVITEKTFYSQLSKSMAGAIVATVIGAGILGGCAFFCGTQLGWGHILSIVLLIALGLCGCLLLYFIIKTVMVRNHPVFRRYGSASVLAQRINNGMRTPCYYAEPLMGGAPFATLMTEDFIVSGTELTSFMELKDLRSVSVGFIPEVRRIVVGNPLMTAASVAANHMTDRYMESRGVNGDSAFDMLVFDDSDGKQHRYGVRRRDIEAFLNALSQIAPHISFKQ